MTTLQSGKTAKYDAWNRMVEVDDGSTIVQENEYDGTNRRIQIFSDFDGSTPDKVIDDYLSGQQVIESDATVDSTRDGGYQTIWSPRYIDAAILRDTLNTAGTGIVAAQRVFYLSDANYNVTGLVKYDSEAEEWGVAERSSYTPYGVVTYRNPDWTTVTSSANSNTILYTGRTLDLLTSLYYYRARYYDAGLERFISRDPITYRGGLDLYEYVGDGPVTRTDPAGLGEWWPTASGGIVPAHGSAGSCNLCHAPGTPGYQPPKPKPGKWISCTDGCHGRPGPGAPRPGGSCPNLAAAIDIAYSVKNHGRCKQWFDDRVANHGAKPPSSFCTVVVPGLLGASGTTLPLLGNTIYVAEKSCNLPVDALAIILIHEMAHHSCPSYTLDGSGERCAVEGQEACQNEVFAAADKLRRSASCQERLERTPVQLNPFLEDSHR
jgi:RHS repeat-associated protein